MHMNMKKLKKIAKFGLKYAQGQWRVPISEKTRWNIAVPVQVYWMVTRRCNFECQFCDVIRHPDNVREELTPEEAVRFVHQMADMGIYKLGISGGEPLLRKKHILAAIRTANEHGIWTGLGTNASLLDEENVVELAEAGVNHLSISLDGMEETQVYLRRNPKAWSGVVNALRLVKEKTGGRMFAKLNYVLNNQNIDEILPVVNFAGENGVSIVFVPYNTYNQGFIRTMTQVEIAEKDNLWVSAENQSKYEAIIDNLIWIKKKSPTAILNTVGHLRQVKTFFTNPKSNSSNACGSAYRNMHIDPLGNVIPCWTFTQSMGNVKTQTLKEIWYSQEYNKIRKAMLKCNLLCMGGCRMYPSIKDLVFDGTRMVRAKVFG